MNIVDEIRNRVSMKDILEYYNIQPTRGKNEYTCLYHSPDKIPSAGITKNGKLYHCFSCGVTVSIFDIVSKIEECDFKSSIKIIDHNFNLGLLRQLTYKEKLELAKQQKERDRLKAEKLELAKFEKFVCNKILEELKIWEKCEKLTHLTRGEYSSGNWKYADLYFYSIKRQYWLNWLYDVLAGIKTREECEFDFIYGSDKIDILKKIKNGNIVI